MHNIYQDTLTFWFYWKRHITARQIAKFITAIIVTTFIFFILGGLFNTTFQIVVTLCTYVIEAYCILIRPANREAGLKCRKSRVRRIKKKVADIDNITANMVVALFKNQHPNKDAKALREALLDLIELNAPIYYPKAWKKVWDIFANINHPNNSHQVKIYPYPVPDELYPESYRIVWFTKSGDSGYLKAEEYK